MGIGLTVSQIGLLVHEFAVVRISDLVEKIGSIELSFEYITCEHVDHDEDKAKGKKAPSIS